MGRTLRERKRRKNINQTVSLSADPNFVDLMKWMKMQGWKKTCVLQMAKFTNTGRGLMAGHNIEKGDIIVSIPKCLLVTTATVFNSAVGEIIIRSSSEMNFSFLSQELLASFLLWERHLGQTSVWTAYITTLPSTFSLPIALSKYHLLNLPNFLREEALEALELVQICFSQMQSYVKNNRCSHCQLLAEEIFTWDNFLWSWCCVNTRAVFIEPEFVPAHPLPLKDKNCLALAPYLDMFNHSDSAEVKVVLNCVNNCYEVTTRRPFKKFKEVFINYGPHSNSKLFFEYGFILEPTVHDTIPTKFTCLINACKSVGIEIKHEYEKTLFCRKHQLDKQLYLSYCGISWNILTVFKILLSHSKEIKLWEQISFMGRNLSVCSDEDLNNIKRNLLHVIKEDITNSLSSVFQKCSEKCCQDFGEKYHPCLETCSMFLKQLISLVETAELA